MTTDSTTTEADHHEHLARGGNDQFLATLRAAFPDALIADDGDRQHFALVVRGTHFDVVIASPHDDLDFLDWENSANPAGLRVLADRYRVGDGAPETRHESRHEWNLDELLRADPAGAALVADAGLGSGFWPDPWGVHEAARRVLAGVVDDIRALHS